MSSITAKGTSIANSIRSNQKQKSLLSFNILPKGAYVGRSGSINPYRSPQRACMCVRQQRFPSTVCAPAQHIVATIESTFICSISLPNSKSSSLSSIITITNKMRPLKVKKRRITNRQKRTQNDKCQRFDVKKRFVDLCKSTYTGERDVIV